ncbi:hypothetical protein [Polaribacter vadi]|uniref:hypothetical protein n=1 Tax=Polaribacter vadi TaxID=1774273 RepID=UPI0030EF9399|tara:strand:- start:14146 stop:14880 length:735 start_codon:yes stop_codon:yes gene_type:complete
MNKIKYLILALTVLIYTGCEDEVPTPQSTNYIAFGDSSYSTGIDIGGATSVAVPVFTANVSGSDRSFDVSVDPASNAAAGSYTVPSSIVIPANSNTANLTVALTDTNLGIGVNNLTLNFVAAESLSTGASTTISYIQNCTEVTLTLDIEFDLYAEETGWAITDALGGVVASKAAESYVRGNAPVTETIVLCAGREYTLTFTDVYSDGMDDGTNLGSYTLSLDGETKVTGGGAFGASEATAFDTK